MNVRVEHILAAWRRKRVLRNVANQRQTTRPTRSISYVPAFSQPSPRAVANKLRLENRSQASQRENVRQKIHPVPPRQVCQTQTEHADIHQRATHTPTQHPRVYAATISTANLGPTGGKGEGCRYDWHEKR